MNTPRQTILRGSRFWGFRGLNPVGVSGATCALNRLNIGNTPKEKIGSNIVKFSYTKKIKKKTKCIPTNKIKQYS